MVHLKISSLAEEILKLVGFVPGEESYASFSKKWNQFPKGSEEPRPFNTFFPHFSFTPPIFFVVAFKRSN